MAQRMNASHFEWAPTIGFNRLHDGGAVAPVAMQTNPTGAYGVAIARISCGEAFQVSGPPSTDHMFGFQHSQTIPVTIWTCGRRLDLENRPGTLVIVPAGADRVAEMHGPFTASIFRVSSECFAVAKAQLCVPGGGLVEQPSGLDDTLFRIGRVLEAEAAAGHPNGVLYWSSAADALIRHLVESHLSTETLPAHGFLSAGALKRLDAFIQDNLVSPLTLESLAALVDCDRFQFARRFRATVGVTPHRYVMRRRLDRACEMMRTRKDSLVEIALATGFFDQSHLCRWVRRVYGASPRTLVHGSLQEGPRFQGH